MKRQKNITKIVVLVVVVFLVLVFGVGQFFSFSNISGKSSNSANNSTTATGTENAAPASQPTQVVRYAPGIPAKSTRLLSGSCWTSSIAAPYRSDAWRCTVGNNIQDPCFQMGDSTSSLLCGMNPSKPNSTSSFILSLTKPLPAPEQLPTDAPSNWAWLVKLQDGTVCSPFTGTLPFAASGETGSYGCAPRYKGDDRMIFDDLNTSSSVWTAEVGTLSASTSTFPPPIIASSTIPILTVWQ